MRYGLSVSRVCSRSQGQPPSPLRRAMSPSKESKRSPAEFGMGDPGLVLEHYTQRSGGLKASGARGTFRHTRASPMTGGAHMAEESEETFKVTDRRGRAREEADTSDAAERRPTAASAPAESPRPTVAAAPAESYRPPAGAA